MKTQKGVTLVSLIIYIILLTVVISMLAVISSTFFKNTQYITNNSKNMPEFNKFNMYFIEDVKNNKNAYIEENGNKVTFEDGTSYVYVKSKNGITDNSIYRNKAKICNNIGYCSFEKTEKEVENTIKQIITVDIAIKGSRNFVTTNKYVLKYW